MRISLDHLIVPTKNRVQSAQLLGTLLGVPWSDQGEFGPFSPVFVNEELTIDFDEWSEPIPKMHYCFKVNASDFEPILSRIKNAGIAFRSLPLGANDNTVNNAFGGSLVYWSEPDGHAWEVLTVSYARQTPSSTSSTEA